MLTVVTCTLHTCSDWNFSYRVLSQDLPEVVVDGAVVVLVVEVEVIGEEVLLSIVVDETLVLPVEKSIGEVRYEQLSLFCKLHHNVFSIV